MKMLSKKIFTFIVIATLTFVFNFLPSQNRVGAQYNDCSEAKLRNLGVAVLDCNGNPNDACSPNGLVSNTSVFVLGDSLTVGMRDAGGLSGKLSAQGWNVKGIEAVEGATIASSLGSITEQNIGGTGFVVIALGTNTDSNFESRVTEIIGKIKSISPTVQIKWVNAYSRVNGYDSVNDTLLRKSTELGYTVIDWKTEALTNPDPYVFASDGIHHTADGYSAKADFITRLLGVTGTAQDENQGSIEGRDNISTIFSFFISKGLTDFQAAGIMGNMHHESGYEPMRAQGIFDRTVPADNWQEAIGGGWGLVQWTPASKMIDKVKAAGQDPNNINVQLEYVWWELTGEWPSSWQNEPPTPSFTMQAGTHLRSTTTVADATLSFETKYERHAGPPQPSRIVEAEKILELARSGAINIVGAGCSTTAGGGNAVKTALEYAWPTWLGKGYTTPKPEYAAAVRAAQAESRYVGSNGIDCGGFVTLVMTNSGFEPRYNYDGRGGPTDTQEAWTKENWQIIGTVSSTAELQPGDVAFTPGHTFMYIGKQPGFETEIASASLDSRAPMAGKESIINDHNGVPVQWYRKK